MVEAGDGATIHFLVLTVTAVHADDSGFAAIPARVQFRSPQCLCPIRSEPFKVIRSTAVTEGVTHHLIGHHALVPGFGKALEPRFPTGSFEDCLHEEMVTAPTIQRKAGSDEEPIGWGWLVVLQHCYSWRRETHGRQLSGEADKP